MATDMLISKGGGLTQLSDETMDKLNEVLPPFWSHGNPVDVLGDADPTRYRVAVERRKISRPAAIVATGAAIGVLVLAFGAAHL